MSFAKTFALDTSVSATLASLAFIIILLPSACLKGKVTQEMLLGWSDLGDEESCSPPSSSPMFGDGDPNGDPVNKAPPAIVATMQTPNGQVSIPLLIPFLITPSLTSSPASAFSTPTPRTGIEAASLEKTVVNGSSKGPINIRTPSSTVITHSTLGAATSSILAASADSLYGSDKAQVSLLTTVDHIPS